MSITRQPYIYLSDNLLALVDLTNQRDDSLVTAAVVSVTVTADATGAPVAGASWPLAMPAVPGAPGKFECTLPLELTMALRGTYTAVITADAGAGLRRRFVAHLVVLESEPV
jgi:hypothetical protein